MYRWCWTNSLPGSSSFTIDIAVLFVEISQAGGRTWCSLHAAFERYHPAEELGNNLASAVEEEEE